MGTRENLIKARELVARGWCKGVYARDAAGLKTDFVAPDAVQFCLVGAIMRVNRARGVYCDDRELEALLDATGISKQLSIFNDSQTSVKPILAAFDAAIANLEPK